MRNTNSIKRLSVKKFIAIAREYGYCVEISFSRDYLIGRYRTFGYNMPPVIYSTKCSPAYIEKMFNLD